jgi:hypothetical protein
LPLKVTVPGPHPKTHGPPHKSTRQLKMKRMIQTTTLPMDPTLLKMMNPHLSSNSTTDAPESHTLNSKKLRQDQLLGKFSQQPTSQRTSTGEIWTERTIFHGTRTNTSQSTVDHAGPKDQPQPSLIDSTLCWEIKTPPQFPSLLKS